MKITLLTGKIFEIEKFFDFPLKVIEPSQCRRLTLRIDGREKRAVLSLPPRCSSKRAIKFVEENRAWIETHLQAVPESKKFSDGDSVTLFGQKMKIKHSPEQKCGVRVENNVIFVSGSQEFLPRRVRDFIKKESLKKLTEMSKDKASQIGYEVNKVTVKDTKSRWGSCSTLGNINYNWRIAFAPMEVADYLVAHEVSHLRHLNHSPEFWSCVKSLCPHSEESRDWLKKNGNLLYIYD